MAPEVMCRQNHTTSVDFFAVGVMAFECMFGRVSVNLLSERRPIRLVSLADSFLPGSERLLVKFK